MQQDDREMTAHCIYIFIEIGINMLMFQKQIILSILYIFCLPTEGIRARALVMAIKSGSLEG